MHIAFYAPLKPPDHPVPSGDRQMARMLIKALGLAGHSVEIVSRLRAYLPDNTQDMLAKLRDDAQSEIDRIRHEWTIGKPADIWLTYHPYYRAPDYLGPGLAARFGLNYVTIEASYARKRDQGPWANIQRVTTDAIRAAALNICFTRRDHDGLAGLGPDINLTYLKPFIDVESFRDLRPPAHREGELRLIAVAMMRKGDKFDSYRMLAAALALLDDLPWHLTVIGAGPLRAEVMDLFGQIPPSRITWFGETGPAEVAPLLCEADLYCWPGCGEAYGLAYLEAEAAGLPAVAQNTAGVPEVVRHEETGILTPAGDIAAFADAIRNLSADRGKLEQLAAQARRFVLTERTLEIASASLNAALMSIANDTRTARDAG